MTATVGSGHGISRTSVNPTAFSSSMTVAGMTPVRRAGTPDDIAAACAFLCSEEAGYITGQQINVNGGWYL